MLVHRSPAITSKHFGPAHFGLSWGMLSVSQPSLAFDIKADAKIVPSTFRRSAPWSTL